MLNTNTTNSIYDNTIPKQLNNFLIYIKTMQGKSENTINGYKIDNRLMLRYLKATKLNLNVKLEDVDISDIDDNFIKDITFADLCMFINYLEEKGNGESDRSRKVSAIKTFFDYLVRKVNLILPQDNPATELEKPKLGKRNPIYLTLEECKHLLSVIKDDTNCKRDLCIITLFLNCGMRLSELANINLSNIKEDMIDIVGKGNKQRVAYLNSMCTNALNEWLEERKIKENGLADEDSKNALFINKKYNRLGNKGIEDLVTKWIKIAGLNEKATCHKLRHSFATIMLEGKCGLLELKELLGHESISTTQIYTHINNEKLRGAVNANPLNM
jgi:integrase/recombinase XerD